MHATPFTRKRSIAILAVGSAVALAAAVAESPGSSAVGSHSTVTAHMATAPDTMVLAFPFTGGHTQYIDQGKKGDSPGDLYLSTGSPVLDNATGRRIGSSDAVEVIVSLRHDGTVTSESTLRLPGGHVELDGVIRHRDDPFRIIVTGGTGRYQGVGGQLTFVRENHTRKVTIMKLELVH
jgi:hypothetical protein